MKASRMAAAAALVASLIAAPLIGVSALAAPPWGGSTTNEPATNAPATSSVEHTGPVWVGKSLSVSPTLSTAAANLPQAQFSCAVSKQGGNWNYVVTNVSGRPLPSGLSPLTACGLGTDPAQCLGIGKLDLPVLGAGGSYTQGVGMAPMSPNPTCTAGNLPSAQLTCSVSNSQGVWYYILQNTSGGSLSGGTVQLTLCGASSNGGCQMIGNVIVAPLSPNQSQNQVAAGINLPATASPPTCQVSKLS